MPDYMKQRKSEENVEVYNYNKLKTIGFPYSIL